MKVVLLVIGITAGLYHIYVGIKRFQKGSPAFKLKHIVVKTRPSELSGPQLIVEGVLCLLAVGVLYMYFK